GGSTGVKYDGQYSAYQDQDQPSIVTLQHLQDRPRGTVFGNSLTCNPYSCQTQHDRSKGKEYTTETTPDGYTVGKQSYYGTQPKQFQRVIGNVECQELHHQCRTHIGSQYHDNRHA